MLSERRPTFQFHSVESDSLPSEVKRFDIAFVGESVDDRGQITTSELRSLNGKAVHSISFIPDTQAITLDGVEKRQRDLVQLISGSSHVLLDATTLGMGEILKLLSAISSAEISLVEFLYAEPLLYTRSVPDGGHAQNREFKLTDNCKFSGVHGFAHEYSQQIDSSHIFILGFEPARVLNAIEQRRFDDEPCNARLYAICGVPAFQFGWELNSIRPHLSVLRDMGIRESSISYCSANSIREAYLTLWDLYRTTGDERSCFFVSPLGTKPHTVATALFLLETKGAEEVTSLYYDHPQRVQGRSKEIKKWHHVTVTFG